MIFIVMILGENINKEHICVQRLLAYINFPQVNVIIINQIITVADSNVFL